MEFVEGDLGLSLWHIRSRGVDLGRPPVHRDRADAGVLRRGQPGVDRFQTLASALVGYGQHAAVFLIGHHCHVLGMLLERGLVHAEMRRRQFGAPGQSAAHRPLQDPVYRVPTQVQRLRHGLGAGLPQSVDDQGLEQRGEAGAGLCPRHRHLNDAMFRAPDPRPRHPAGS